MNFEYVSKFCKGCFYACTSKDEKFECDKWKREYIKQLEKDNKHLLESVCYINKCHNLKRLEKENKLLKKKIQLTYDYMRPLAKLWDKDIGE